MKKTLPMKGKFSNISVSRATT